MPATVTVMQPRRWCEDMMRSAATLLGRLPESDDRRRAVLRVAAEVVSKDDALVRAAAGWLLGELPSDRAEALALLACMTDLDRSFSR
jgi:hypothetical protein